MNNCKHGCRFLALMISIFTFSQVKAGDFEWSGLYRIEGYQIKNSELSSKRREKAYGLHHLVLKPKIIAADGLIINSRFDIFNSTGDLSNSPLGMTFGHGVNTDPTSTPTSTNNSNTSSQNESVDAIQVSQLYLTLVQEFGALIVGRAPLQFGLGVTHNAGSGMFDHYMDTRDLVGYKIVVGNLWFLPMIGKVNEGRLNRNDDVTDLMIQVQYDNPGTDMEMGVFFQERRASRSGNDAVLATDTGEAFGGAGATLDDKWASQHFNVFALKDTEFFRLGLEAGFQSGKAGVATANRDKVSLSGYGIAGEFEWRPQASHWKFGSHLGIATGDDPETDDEFEGFFFDRNYDVAFLMFNHPLGQADFLRNKINGGGPTGSKADASQAGDVDQPDVEAISNVVYLSPYFKYKWTDRWSLSTNLTMGWLNKDPLLNTKTDNDLGYEVDFSLNFVPNKRVTWVNQVGLLFPGAAFEAGGIFDSKFAYGLVTKAAISF